MSELPPSPLQTNINRDGGLYDQARDEDTARFAARAADQDAIYATYDDNIRATQRREQDEAYATYEENIQITRDREKAELKELKRKLRVEKIKRGFGKVAVTALMIPGIDYVAELIDEEVISMKLNKKSRDDYKATNGTLFGNKQKGYQSTLAKRYEKHNRRFTGKSEPIIQDLQTLIAEHEQRMQ